MFEKDNNLENTPNSSGKVFHDLDKEEMLNISGGTNVESNSLKYIFAVSSTKCGGAIIGAGMSASISAILGVISYHHC